MKVKKCTIVPILVMIFAILTYILIMHKNLSDYKIGFALKGTYQTNNLAPTEAEYLVFSEEIENQRTVFYYFKQHGINEKGYYINSENVNLYKLSIESDLDGSYILVDKGVVYLINDDSILRFEKISEKEVFINSTFPAQIQEQLLNK